MPLRVLIKAGKNLTVCGLGQGGETHRDMLSFIKLQPAKQPRATLPPMNTTRLPFGHRVRAVPPIAALGATQDASIEMRPAIQPALARAVPQAPEQPSRPLSLRHAATSSEMQAGLVGREACTHVAPPRKTINACRGVVWSVEKAVEFIRRLSQRIGERSRDFLSPRRDGRWQGVIMVRKRDDHRCRNAGACRALGRQTAKKMSEPTRLTE